MIEDLDKQEYLRIISNHLKNHHPEDATEEITEKAYIFLSEYSKTVVEEGPEFTELILKALQEIKTSDSER